MCIRDSLCTILPRATSTVPRATLLKCLFCLTIAWYKKEKHQGLMAPVLLFSLLLCLLEPLLAYFFPACPGRLSASAAQLFALQLQGDVYKRQPWH